MILVIDMDCLFCSMVKGEIPCEKVYEDENVLVFLDIHPKAKGHTLLIPKKHFQDLTDIEDKYLLCIMKSAQKMKQELETKYQCDGLQLVQNNGALQEVKHFHLHMIPFYNKKK